MSTDELAKPALPTDAPAISPSRRARRASSETISAPVDDEIVVAPEGPVSPSASRASAATVSRRAARAAAAAAAAATAASESAPGSDDAPIAVAASGVATLRPHTQKVGRRAAEASSDEIERPAAGRRAIVSGPTTALPEIIETAAIPLIETAAPILPAAMAEEQIAPAKAVSRRTLRTAAIVPDAASGTAPRASGATGPGAGTGAGAGAGNADDAKPPTGRRSRRRGIAKGGFSALALIFATGIAVATTMPAEALHAASEQPAVSILSAADSPASVVPKQQLTTSADVAGASIARDGYSVRDTAALKAAGFRIADTFTNNPTGAIQWPFPVGVPISDGFGARESPGGIGSTDHKGVDFAPGQGTPIQSIADGVVSSVEPYDNSGLGVHVIIDHVVDGQKVSSVYGHMLTGSIQVAEGQVVKVAQTVGLVGNTGASTGPHLHLEIRLDGVTPVDPFAWLQTHAV